MPRLQSSRGQVALILILLTAVALVFYAVSLNLGRISEVKTRTQIAAATGASSLASGMASYGQNLLMTQLGGKRKVCDNTSLLVAIILLVVVIIILIIILIICWGGCITAVLSLSYIGIGLILASVGAALALTAVILNAAVLQPGITSAWNKIFKRTLNVQDNFLESGIQAAFFSSLVDDPVMTPDIFDMDQDGVFGYDTSSGAPKDYVSRVAYYYNQRVRNIKPIPIPEELDDFMVEMEEFIDLDTSDPADWGLVDRLDCAADPSHPCCGANTPGDPIPSYCNPCCVPAAVDDPRDTDSSDGIDQVDIRPLCCDDADLYCGTASTCQEQSPYNNYQYIYENLVENDLNFFPDATPALSFREQIGRDDEHKLYKKFPGDPNGIQFSEQPADIGFHLKDATGYYTPPVFPTGPDHLTGIYPTFYKLSDWLIDPTRSFATNNPAFCAVVDDSWFGFPICNGTLTAAMPQELLTIRQNMLSGGGGHLFRNDPSDLIRNTTYFVDNMDTFPPGEPPLPPDLIRLPGDIIGDPGECAQLALSTGQGFWKHGVDRFCSGGDFPTLMWPYTRDCPRNLRGSCTEPDPDGGTIVVDCECMDAPTNPALFNEDLIDDMVYGIVEFMQWAQPLLDLYATNPNQIAASFRQWFLTADEWFSPYDDICETDPTDACCSAPPVPPGCEPKGKIYKWRDTVVAIKERLETFLTTSFTSTSADPCYDAWCSAPQGCVEEVPGELTDANANGVFGDYEDVISCLNYNIEGVDSGGNINPVGTNLGNDERFRACSETCLAADCDNLPRSLIPYADYNPQAFTIVTPAREADVTAMYDCLKAVDDGNLADACTAAQLSVCQAMPWFAGGASCFQYFTENPANFDVDACSYDAGVRYFTNNPATSFDEVQECYAGIVPHPVDPATVDFANDPTACADPNGWGPGNEWYDRIINWVIPLSNWGYLYNVPPTDPTFSDDFNKMINCLIAFCGSDVNTHCQQMPQVPTDPNLQGTFNGTWTSPNGTTFAPSPYFSELGQAWFYLWSSVDPATGLNCNFVYSDADMQSMVACASDCTQANCASMPYWRNQWGIYPGPNPWFNQAVDSLIWLTNQGRAAGDPDYDAIVNCLVECSTGRTVLSKGSPACEAACQAMPMFDSMCAVQYFLEDPAESSPPTPSNGIGFEQSDCINWGPGNDWYDQIVGSVSSANPSPPDGDTSNGAILMANPSCDLRNWDGLDDTTTDNGWLLNTELSYAEAVNQVDKFKIRRAILEPRLAEMNNVIQVMTAAETEFNDLLDISEALYSYADANYYEGEGLPNMLIYGWQGEPPKDNPSRSSGYWHLVMLQGALPLRCYNSCSANPLGGSDPRWPWIESETSNGGLKRCYELKSTEGIVKFRATRWDEDRDPNEITFPNGVPLWSFRKPMRMEGAAAFTGNDLTSNCANLSIYNQRPELAGFLPSPLTPTENRQFKGAFMLNRFDPVNEQCWRVAQSLLSTGVMTEVCAEYYYHGGMKPGLGFKFFDCGNLGAPF